MVEAVEHVIRDLNAGRVRVATRQGVGQWTVNQWVKKAVLLSFRLKDNEMSAGAPGGASWWDKVPSKFAGMDAAAYEAAWTIDTTVDPYHETWRVQAPPMVRVLAETQEWFMRQRLPPDPLAMMVCGLLYAPIFRRARVYTAAIEGVR